MSKLKSLIVATLAFAASFVTGSALAATPVAVWSGNFAGAETGVASGKYTLKANGNTVADDGSAITISSNVGVLVDWTDRSDFSTAGNITVIVKYSDYTVGANNGAAATLWAGSATANKDIVGPFTTASTGILNNIWNGAADGRGTKENKVLPASGVFSFDYSGNTAPKGSTTYIENNGTFEEACSGNGTLYTSTKDFYGLAVGGSRNAYNNLKALTGMKILGVAIFNERLTVDEIAAYEFPERKYCVYSQGTASGWGGNCNYNNNLNAIKLPETDAAPAGTKVEVTKLEIAQSPGGNTDDNRPTRIAITVDGKTTTSADFVSGGTIPASGGNNPVKLTYNFPEGCVLTVGTQATIKWLKADGSEITSIRYAASNDATGRFLLVNNGSANYSPIALLYGYALNIRTGKVINFNIQNTGSDGSVSGKGAQTTLIGSMPEASWNNNGSTKMGTISSGIKIYNTNDGTTEDTNMSVGVGNYLSGCGNYAYYGDGGTGTTGNLPNDYYYLHTFQTYRNYGNPDSGIEASNIKLTGIPFEKYDVIVYFNGSYKDGSNEKFHKVNITCNGVSRDYTVDANGAFIAGTADWGATRQVSSAYGVNAAVFTDVATADFELKLAEKYANIAAFQVVERVIPRVTSKATISEDTNWSEIQWDPAVEDFSTTKLELTVENNAKITLDEIVTCVGLAINGVSTFDVAEDLYEDGCWEKQFLSAKSFTSTGTISFGALKEGFYGAFTQTEKGISLRAQNKEVISINIAGGSGGGAGGDSPAANLVSGTGFYGIAPTVGDSWNNINRQWQSGGNQTITIDGPNAYDGKDVIKRETMSLSATGKNTWQAGSISNPFLRGYLDDGSGVTVEVHGVPYTEYDVIVYATSDSASIALAPITINGKQYTFKNGATTEGSDVWGQGLYATPEIGKNALRVNGCTGDTITINAVRTGGRATLCGVQVINKGEVVLKEDFSATITDSIKFSDITWDGGKTFKEGQLNEVVITVGDGTDEEVNLTFDNPDMMLGKITVVSSRPIRFTATKALPNVGQFITDGCTGGIVYAWPVSALTTSAEGVTYAGGAGTVETPATMNFAVANGSMTLKDATYYLGTSYSGVQSTVNMIDATIFANGDMGFGVGQANFNLSGTTKLTSEKVVLSQGGGGRTANLTLSDSAEVIVTGSSIVDSNQSSIMFGHYAGPSTFTIEDSAKFTAEDAQVLVGKTGGDQTININGGVFTAKGIKASAGATGTNALNLNDGELKLGEYGITTYNAARTISVTVDGNAKITSTAAMPITQALTINADKTLTLDATAGDIVISGTVVNNGTIKVVGGNVIFMPGTANGTIVEEGGKALYGYIVSINDCGKFTIPEGKTAENIRLFDGAGNVIPFTDNKDGTVSYEWKITGGACWWDYEFNGNGDNDGTDGRALSWDNDRPFKGDEYVDGEKVHVPTRPWRDVSSWPTTATFVMYGTMPSDDNRYYVVFGSTTHGLCNAIFLATDKVSEDKVVLCKAYGRSGTEEDLTKLCTMTVPNAQTADHLYAFVLKNTDTQTIIDIYLDGELLQSYPFGEIINLGTGFQIASPHGGPVVGYERPDDADEALLDWLRVYDVELTKEVLERYAVLYPYVSPNGSYQRTVTEDADWSATDAWTKEGTEPAETADEPAAGATVKLAIDNDDATTTIAINLADDVIYEAIQINGDDVEFVLAEGEEFGGIAKSTGRVTANANITFAYNAFSMAGAPLTVKQGMTVTFDLSMVDMTKFFSTQTYDLTGYLTLEDGAEVTFIVPEELHGRTAEATIDPVTKHYVLTVTAPNYPFVYEDGVWTWGTQVIDEETINAHPEVLRSIKSDLEMALGTSDYSVENGATLTQTDASATGTITINEGGTFDVNGVIDTALKIVLNGGSLINDGSDIDAGKKQYVSITQTAASTIGGSGEFGYVLSGYGENTLDLGGATLTKMDDNTFSLCNATVQNGTLKVADGVLAIANKAVTIADTATIEGVEGAVLSVGSSISDFTLTGAITLAGAGTFGTITLDDAALDIDTVRGLTVAGEGSIKATITADEMAGGSVVVFTKAEDATISSVTLYDEAGEVLSGYTADYDEDGNYIANFSVTFTVASIDGATAAFDEGYVIGEDDSVTVPYGATATLVYTANEGKLFNDGKTTVTVLIENITDAATAELTIAAAIADKSTVDAEAKIGSTLYLTLADAFAVDGQKYIVLLKDVELTDWIVVDSVAALELNGFTISQSASWAPAETSHDHLFCVTYGGTFSVLNAYEEGGTIDATGNGDLYGAIKMTKKGDVRQGEELASLTVFSGTIIGNTAAISGNGTRHGTSVTIGDDYGSTLIKAVVANDSVGIFNPQDGTVTITGGTIEGAMGIIIKSGSLLMTGGKVVANGEYAEWVKSNNGFNNTGDAIEIDNIGYPGEVAEVLIGGDVIVESANGAAVASRADGAYTPITGFIAGGKFKGAIDTDTSLIKTTETGIGKWVTDEDGYKVPAEDPAMAKIGTKLYLTLAEAVTAATDNDEVTLLASCAGDGIKIDKSITIDFGGFTYTVDASLVGSPSTQSQAFNLVRGNTITLKNGTITSTVARMLVQNYASLTLEDMTLDGTNLAAKDGKGKDYVADTLSNCAGDTVITGDSVIKARVLDGQKSFAFDTYYQAGKYEDATVTVDGATINGNVELAGGSLTLTAGTLNGELVEGANIEKGVVTKDDAFEAAAPAGYEWKDGVLTAIYPAAKVEPTTVDGFDYAFIYTALNDAPKYDDAVASFVITPTTAVPADTIKVGGKFATMGWNIFNLPAIGAGESYTITEATWAEVKDISPFTCGAASIALEKDTEVTLTLKLGDDVIDTQTVTLKAAKVLPTAIVAEAEVTGLDKAATFTLDNKGISYDDWNADFMITLDKDVEAGQITLGGDYGEYGLVTFPAPAFTAGEAQGVMAMIGKTITVAELDEFVQEFTCGIKNNTFPTEFGVSVQLVITKGGETINIGEPFEATIPAAKVLPEASVTPVTVEGLDKAAMFGLVDKGVGYDDWNADFTITLDQDVAAGQISLGGAYGQYGLITFPAPEFKAGVPQNVMALYGDKVTVAELDAIKLFVCGIKNNTFPTEFGVSVQLVIYDGETTIDIGDAFEATIPAAKVLPTASVAATTLEGLDTAATFTLESKGINYDDWNADFTLTLDKDVEAGQISLGGIYGEYGLVKFPTPALTAGQAYGVMELFGQTITVAELAEYVKEFTCGVKNNTFLENLGVTVQLVITDGETTIKIGDAFEATVEAVEPFDPEVPQTYNTPEAAQEAADTINDNKLTMINIPTVVTDKQAYVDLFEAVAEGTTVTVQLTEDAKGEIAEELKNADAAATILTPDEDGKATIIAKPGLWYGIKAEGSLYDMPTAEGQNWEQATDDTVAVKVPVVTDSEGNKAKAAFFQATCSAKAPTK